MIDKYDGTNIKAIFNNCLNATFDLSISPNLTEDQKQYFKKFEEVMREARNYVYMNDIDTL